MTRRKKVRIAFATFIGLNAMLVGSYIEARYFGPAFWLNLASLLFCLWEICFEPEESNE